MARAFKCDVCGDLFVSDHPQQKVLHTTSRVLADYQEFTLFAYAVKHRRNHDLDNGNLEGKTFIDLCDNCLKQWIHTINDKLVYDGGID